MKKFFIFAFCAALLTTEQPRAEEKEEKYTLEEVVVTATKTEETRKDVPNAVILKDELDIQESPANSVGVLLANEPGIDLRTRGNYGGASEEIHIRGMNASGTQVLVNGINYNSPSFGSADVSKIPINSIERIEVVKGSGALLYGSGAIGGVVSIFTKGPEKNKPTFKASKEIGYNNTHSISAEQGMFVTNHLGYYLTVNSSRTEGYRDNSDLDRKDVSMKLVWDEGDFFNASLYGDYLDSEYGRPGIDPPKGTQDYYSSVTGAKFYNKNAASLLDKGKDEDTHIALDIDIQPFNWLKIGMKDNYTVMKNYNYSRYTFDGSGAKTLVTNKVAAAEINAEVNHVDNYSLLLGAECKTYDWENENLALDTTGSEIPSTKVDTSEDLYTAGGFIEVQYKPFPILKTLAGVRYEDHSEFGTEYLPCIGLIFNPVKNSALKINHGKQFLAPTPNDLFWPKEDWGWGMGAEGNPDLKPETGYHSDISLEQEIGKKLFITGSLFTWDMNNRILWTGDAAGFYRPINLKSYEAKGAELGMKIGPFTGLTLGLSYTYLDAEEKALDYDRKIPGTMASWKTHPATYSPEHQFKGTITLETPGDMTMSMTTRYVSERLWYQNETSDWLNYKTVVYVLKPYWTADLKITKYFNQNWNGSLAGSNLFNKRFDTYLEPFRDINLGQTTIEGYPGAGRYLSLNIVYEY